jgi:cytochrome c
VLRRFVVLALAAWSTPGPVQGQQVFNRWRGCHSLQDGATMIGPRLHGIFGRKAGSEPGNSYSSVMTISSDC